MTAVSVFLRLVFAHILSDFFLQTGKMARGKRSDGTRWAYLSVHSLIHSVVAYVMLAMWSAWHVPVVMFVSHFVIDMIKCRFDNSKPSVFVVDQIAHLAVIVLLWISVIDENLKDVVANAFSLLPDNYWRLLIAYALMLSPSSIFLSLLLRKWTLSDHVNDSLPEAGKWIGYLERVMAITFVITGNMEGVGFLLAAKSIFRFGDLNKAKDIKTTEYVMIGTMASFAIAILTGLLVR